MANPIAFEPKRVDPRLELQRRLNAAPVEHAEALLAAFDLLEEAHSRGVLELMHGAIGSKNAVLGKLAEYAKEPESTNALRNLLLLGKVLGSIDPERLKEVSREKEPPSLWQIWKRVRSKDGRRGLGFLTAIIMASGRSD